MSKQLHLEIVTPDRHLYSGEADRVILRTTGGDMAVLYDHEPTVTPLSIGAIRIQLGDKEMVASCCSGFVNINETHVTIITDASEWAQDIDKARAEAARERAKQRVDRSSDQDIDDLRARLALAKAINRISIVEKYL